MLSEIFKQQQEQIKHYFDTFDVAQGEAFFQECLNCQGLLVFTGVGKSGIIAEKIAMTLISTGTKALYLPPTNFLHGDIGILTEKDVFVLISKSGETEELLSLIPFARRRKARILTIVSNPASRLAKECDATVNLPVSRELCPFDLAPTTSTAVQLLFGDLLAVALMRAKEFSIKEYALNHPSGTIGKKLTLFVDDIMFKDEQIPKCSPDAPLVNVLVELSNKKCGCLVIVDPEDQLLGIFTDGDLRRGLQRNGAQILSEPMGKLMTTTPLSIPKGVLAIDAMKIMQKDSKPWVQVLPVVEGQKVVGMIRMHDIVQAGLSE